MLPLRLNNTKYLSVINSFSDNTDDVICYRNDYFTDIDEKVNQLVIEACEYSPGSAERQKSLTEIMRLISDKLWQENTPYYQDALQQTWVYFCQNLCERNTAQSYDSSRESVITWVNTYLKQRLQDLYIEDEQQARKVIVELQISQPNQVNETLDLDDLEANSNTSLLLEEVITWVETDPEGELRRIHIKGYPKVTCQELLRRRLPPVTSWKELVAEFHLPVSTLSSFYQQQCLPRLRQFGGVKI